MASSSHSNKMLQLAVTATCHTFIFLSLLTWPASVLAARLQMLRGGEHDLAGSGNATSGFQGGVETSPMSKEQFWRELKMAIKAGDVKTATSMIGGATPTLLEEAQDGNGWNALMLAAEEGSMEIVRLLCDRESPASMIEAQDDLGWNALMVAVAHKHEEIAKYLIDRGSLAMIEAQVGNGSYTGWTALMLTLDEVIKGSSGDHERALRMASIEIAKYLIERRGSPAMIEAKDRYGRNALMMAARNGREEFAKYLIDRAGDAIIEAQDKEGWNALMWAARNGHEEIAKYLIKHGSPTMIEAQDDDGMNALMWAASKGRAKTVESLLESESASALLQATDNKGRSALTLAMEENIDSAAATTRIKEVLIKTANCAAVATALFYWAGRGHVKHVEWLLSSMIETLNVLNPATTKGKTINTATCRMFSLVSGSLSAAIPQENLLKGTDCGNFRQLLADSFSQAFHNLLNHEKATLPLLLSKADLKMTNVLQGVNTGFKQACNEFCPRELYELNRRLIDLHSAITSEATAPANNEQQTRNLQLLEGACNSGRTILIVALKNQCGLGC